MTAAQQISMAVAALQGTNYSVVVGSSGGNFGFVGGSLGSISPASFKGKTIDRVTSSPGVNDLRVEFPLTVTQSFFRGILLQKSDGNWVRYESSAATFSGGSISAGIWTWGAGAVPVWNATGTFSIIFYF